MAKHFVTGAAGFLGSQIVDRLVSKKEDVVTFDILECEKKHKNVKYIKGDIKDLNTLIENTKGIDYIHHNAALVPLTKSGKDFAKVNIGGTKNIVKCCRENGVKKLVYMSSSAIYGLPEDMPITQKTEYKPIEIYGQSKLDAEKEIWKYMDDGGKAACIRPRTIIGGKSRLGIFQILFEWISEGRNIYVIGKGNNLFQFVHVDDLIDASIKAAFTDMSGLYNIGSNQYGTLRDDLEKLIKHAGTKSKINSLPVNLTKLCLYLVDVLQLSPLAPWHYLTYHKPFVFDISKAQEDLRWKPEYGNVDSLCESYDWYLCNKDNLSEVSKSTHTKPVKQGILKVLKLLS